MPTATATKRTRIIAALSAAALALGLGVTGAGAAQAAETGSISGTVTLPDGAPAEWMAGVVIYAESEGYSAGVAVEPDGSYTIAHLPPGSYSMTTWSERYWDEDDNAQLPPPLLPIHTEGSHFKPDAAALVVDGNAITGVDLQLQQSYSISGIATLTNGLMLPPLEGVSIRAIDGDGAVAAQAWINMETGEYMLSGLPAGSYMVEFLPGTYSYPGTFEHVQANVQHEYYNDTQDIDDATLIDVTDGDVTDVDVELLLTPAPQVTVDVSRWPASPYYTQFHQQIRWLLEEEISTGFYVGAGKYEFRPKAPSSREAMAAFLYRHAGSPEVIVPETSPFVDVVPGSQFYKEIVWLSEQGISTGWDMGDWRREFRPKEPIARDAMAAFMYRYAGEPAFTPPPGSPFTDLSPTGTKFYEEITWLATMGISTGWHTGGGQAEYRPYSDITREAMAAFLYRYDRLDS